MIEKLKIIHLHLDIELRLNYTENYSCLSLYKCKVSSAYQGLNLFLMHYRQTLQHCSL